MLSSFIKIWEFSKKRKPEFIKSMIFSFIKGLTGITQMVAIIYAIYALTGAKSPDECLKWIVIMGIICILGMFIIGYGLQMSIIRTGMYMVADKRMSFGDKLRNVYLGFFNNSSVGRISATMTTTLSSIEMAAPTSLILVAGGILSSLAIIIAMLFYEWHIGVITVIGMVTYFLAVNWQMKISRREAPYRQEAQTKLSEATVSFLQGIKVTKAFSFKQGDRALKSAIEGSRDGNIRLTDKSMFSQVTTQLAVVVFECLIIVLSLLLCFKWHTIGIESAVVLIILSFMIYAPMNQAGSILSMIGMLDSSLKEVEELEMAEEFKIENPHEIPSSNEIVFDNVSFSYGEREVLHNISVGIKPDSLTAVIGPSGSGKTTLCQLIPRFWDVNSGSIKIGGADIRNIETNELMSRISMVFQRCYLFEDTILNNIRFGKPDASLDEVRTAAKQARCDEFIMSLPNGYDTVISEGGNSLSGGEKQRISIARAILKNSPIIILDEATSALDYENEQAILEAVDELTKNKTVIMIAHRMKTVRNADHIIAIDDGRVAEEGTHDELIQKNGVYSRFVKERSGTETWKIR